MVLTVFLWSSYRRLAERYPVIRRVLAPIRWMYHFNYLSYGWHRVRGGSFRDWYAKQLNAYARNIDAPPMEGDEEHMGAYQLEYLKGHGLRPDQRFMDFGCGYLRAGVHFIGYLNPGHYVGVDISSGRLQQGVRQVVKFGLEYKRPELILIQDLTLDAVAPRQFDVIWSHGVIGHMPIEDVEQLLKHVHKVMKPAGVFYANYTALDAADARWVPRRVREADHHWVTVKDVFYNYRVFDRLCRQYGLASELLPDWHNEIRDASGNPHPLAAGDRLLKITLAPTSFEMAPVKRMEVVRQ